MARYSRPFRCGGLCIGFLLNSLALRQKKKCPLARWADSRWKTALLNVRPGGGQHVGWPPEVQRRIGSSASITALLKKRVARRPKQKKRIGDPQGCSFPGSPSSSDGEATQCTAPDSNGLSIS
jgi:hypothetical protein